MHLHYHLIEQIVEALLDIMGEGFYADKVIERRMKAHPKWGARDRRQFAETVYEIVRWWRWHWYLAGLPMDEYLNRETLTIYRIWTVWGAYWVQKIGSKPPFGELEDLDEEAVKERAETEVPAAVRASMPDWLNDLGMKQLKGEWPDLCRALNRPADVFIRANTTKIKLKPLMINLAKEDVATEYVPGLDDALKLAKRQNIFRTKCFAAGLFEVQDGGSQMIAPFLQPEPGMRVIDACAGGGGKALHIACLMKNQGLIQALDIHEWKLDELRKRFRRNEITIIDPKLITGPGTIKLLNKKADRVLLDVPCSGLGVLRRNPDAKWKLQPEEIERLVALQAQILRDYSSMVKPGGKLVYATCSVLPQENERQIEAFLREHVDEWTLEAERRWTPNKNGFDGFYAARLVRSDKPVAKVKKESAPAEDMPSEAKPEADAASAEG